MQREEKQLDSSLEVIIMRVNVLKSAITNMLFKLEHEYETLNWPTFLDNFALMSGHKQVAAYTKVVGHVWEIVSKAREEWESEAGSRSGTAQTYSINDTNTLVAAIGMGKGLKAVVQQPVQTGPQGMMVAPVGRPGAGGPQQQGQIPHSSSGQIGPLGKAPSAIKTNIKAASQIHPYSR